MAETWEDQYGADHRETFSTTPALLPDKIKVGGSHWCEPAAGGSGCTLFFELDVQVKIFGVGSTLAKALADGLFAAYESIPRRASEFLALQRGKGLFYMGVGLLTFFIAPNYEKTGWLGSWGVMNVSSLALAAVGGVHTFRVCQALAIRQVCPDL